MRCSGSSVAFHAHSSGNKGLLPQAKSLQGLGLRHSNLFDIYGIPTSFVVEPACATVTSCSHQSSARGMTRVLWRIVVSRGRRWFLRCNLSGGGLGKPAQDHSEQGRQAALLKAGWPAAEKVPKK